MTLHLLQPVVDATGTTWKNRVVFAPLTRGRADPETGCVGQLVATYYSQRSSGGCIVSEATAISRQGHGWWGGPGIYTPEHVEAWKLVTQAVHEAGGLILCQLWHMGRAGHSDVFGSQPVSASPIALNGECTAKRGEKKPYEVPRELPIDEIRQTVEDYACAAENALKAGFDGVQLHAANGYLIDQFMQSVSNYRSDLYGGSLENRMRFLREVLAAVTNRIPKERVWIRFSPNGSFNGMGNEDNLETFDAAVSTAASFGIGGIEILDGLAFGFHAKTEPYTLQRARGIMASAATTKAGVAAKPPLLCGGCGYTLEAAEEQLKLHHADLIAFGRLYISNPDLPERFRDNLELNPVPDRQYWWRPGEECYTTYPPASRK